MVVGAASGDDYTRRMRHGLRLELRVKGGTSHAHGRTYSDLSLNEFQGMATDATTTDIIEGHGEVYGNMAMYMMACSPWRGMVFRGIEHCTSMNAASAGGWSAHLAVGHGFVTTG